MVVLRVLSVCLFALGGVLPAVAEETAEIPTVRDPDLDQAGPADEELEPEVRIIEQGQGQVEEYRRGGILYMIKVVPARGFPYYLVDSDGDGQLDTRRNDLDPDVIVPRWTLFRFD